MASQQPTRPWFRLPYVARPAPPPPPAVVPEAPPPQPRPPPMRPTFRSIAQPQPQPQPSAAPPTTTLPPPVSVPPPRPQPPPQTVTAPPPSPPPPATTPKPAPPNPTPSSVPSSPQRQSIVPSTPSPIRNRDTTAARVATTPPPQSPPLQQLLEPSPRTIKPMLVRTPPPQPTASNHASPPPPSPLVLPPPQAIPDPRIPPEVDQKTVLVQNKFADTETRKLHHHPPPPPRMRVITIAGENKGAFMELVRPQQRSISSPNFLNRRGNTSSGEERGGDGKRNGSGSPAPPRPMRAFANSNVQGVNNSIVYNSSCSHHDPGVHLSISSKLDGGGPSAPPAPRHRSKEGPTGDNSSGHLSN